MTTQIWPIITKHDVHRAWRVFNSAMDRAEWHPSKRNDEIARLRLRDAEEIEQMYNEQEKQ